MIRGCYSRTQVQHTHLQATLPAIRTLTLQATWFGLAMPCMTNHLGSLACASGGRVGRLTGEMSREGTQETVPATRKFPSPCFHPACTGKWLSRPTESSNRTAPHDLPVDKGPGVGRRGCLLH